MTTIAGRVIEQKKNWTAGWSWTGHATHPWNQYVYFRKLVDVPADPKRVLVRVSADALYTLFVNGHRVHHGPARCFPIRQSFDTLDLTGLFHAGKNVIGAIVYQFGAPTFQRVFRDASGFLLDGVIETEAGPAVPLHTPAGWTCRPAKGWRKNTRRLAIQLGFQEHFDADADSPDWLSVDFVPTPEDGWKDPWNLGPVGTHPWLLMEPRGVPLLADHVEPIAAVVAQFRGENPRGYKVVDDVYHLVTPAELKKDNTAIESAAAMLADDETTTTITPPPEGEFVAVTLDLGDYRTGHLMLEIADASGDEFIDVLFAEEIEKTQIPLMVSGTGSSQEATALRYRCRPGAQQWESFFYIGMRYLLVVFRNVETKPLQVKRIAIRQVHTAFENAGSFTCSDDRLNAIWKVGVNTQLNCSFDAFVDCPWREQAMWWGDARVQSLVTAHAFGDSTLLERGIRLIGQSQTPDGALHAHAPADIPRHRLPDFMMTWVGTLWDHYWQTARTDLIHEYLPTMHRVLEFLAAHESPDGLIGTFDGYWMFLDWVPIFKGNYSAPFNLLYLQTLRWAATLCRLDGQSTEAAAYDLKAAASEASAIKYFFNEKTKVWRDGHDAATNQPVEQISQHTNTLAILLGLMPETHADLAKNVLLKSAKTKRGKTITASPFFYAYVLSALSSQGFKSDVIDIIRDKWGSYFLDLNAKTFYEMWTVTIESRCHAWSSSPVYHLMQVALGITQIKPGWTEVRIAPTLATLEFARGTLPTPRGMIRVEWEKAGDDQLAVVIDLPPTISGEFVSPDGHHRQLEPGVNEFHT